METLTFEIIGKPKPKERPRFSKKGFCFTPKNTAMFENLVKHEAYEAMKKQNLNRFETQVEVSIIAYFETTKSMFSTKKQREIIPELIRAGKLRPSKKPDIDNIVKAIMDGLNGVAYKDDALVVKIMAQKFYGDIQR